MSKKSVKKNDMSGKVPMSSVMSSFNKKTLKISKSSCEICQPGLF